MPLEMGGMPPYEGGLDWGAETPRSLSERYRMWQQRQRSLSSQAAQPDPLSREALGLSMLPSLSGLGDMAGDAITSIGRGIGRMTGQLSSDPPLNPTNAPISLAPPPQRLAIEDYLDGLGQQSPPVGADGIPEVARRPQGMNYPAPVQEPAGRVQATINGKTYDYSNGREGGAPTLGGMGNGLGKQWGDRPDDQTMEYSQPGIGRGTVSQMLPLEDAMKSQQQLEDETKHLRARPATGDYAAPGRTQGDALNIQERGIARAMDPRVQREAQMDERRAQAAQRLTAIQDYLASKGATPDEIRQGVEAAAKDIFLELGISEGELGAVGSYLKPNANSLGG